MNNIQSQIGTSNKELDFDQRQKLYVLPSTEERVKGEISSDLYRLFVCDIEK